MSHKQLYTKIFHLNQATIGDMGMVAIFNFDDPSENKSFFNSIIRLNTSQINTNFMDFLPEDAEIVSMTANNKYFFILDQKWPSSVLPITLEPFIITLQGLYSGPNPTRILSILVKCPSKELIPNGDKVYCILKSFAQESNYVYPFECAPFNYEHLLNIDLVVNYILPD